MSSRNLDDWIDGYVKYLNNTESPHLYKKWVAISAIAAALRRKCHITLQYHRPTYPNMYIVLIGPPAIGKGISMGPVEEMLRSSGITLSADSATRQALIRDLTEATDSTLEGSEIDQNSSLTIFSKELSVFLAHNDVQLLKDLTDWFDCANVWSYDTRGRGKEEVRGLFVNLLGATTPGVLRESLPENSIGGGLTSRMIFVYTENRGRTIPIYTASEKDKQLFISLSIDLDRISHLSGAFKFDSTLVNKWIDWYVPYRANPIFKQHPRLRFYAERRPQHLTKLMMILNASRVDDMIITGRDFDRGMKILEEVEETMPLTFEGYGRNPQSDLLKPVMIEIKEAGVTKYSDFVSRHMADLDPEGMERLLRTLQQIKFCKLVTKESGLEIHYIEENER